MKKVLIIILFAASIFAQYQIPYGTKSQWARNSYGIFSLDTAAKIGIGTIIPTSKLHIKNNANTTAFQIDNNNGTNLVTVDSSGKMGFRTVTPIANLAVVVDSTSRLDSNTVAVNLVYNGTNKIRSTLAQSRDTSSFNIGFTPYTGKPYLNLSSNTGSGIFNIDTIGSVSFGSRLYAVQDSLLAADSTISWATGNSFYQTMTSNKTYVFTNTVDGQVINFAVYNSGTYTAAFTAGDAGTSIVWAGGIAPTQTANKTDVYTFIRLGRKIYSNVKQNF